IGVLKKDFANLVRDRTINVKSRTNKDQAWAALHGSSRRHGRMYAVLARFIAGGGHYAALLGRAAYRHRLSAIAWLIALLNRCIKRIHVDVDYFAHQLPAHYFEGEFCMFFRRAMFFLRSIECRQLTMHGCHHPTVCTKLTFGFAENCLIPLFSVERMPVRTQTSRRCQLVAY